MGIRNHTICIWISTFSLFIDYESLFWLNMIFVKLKLLVIWWVNICSTSVSHQVQSTKCFYLYLIHGLAFSNPQIIESEFKNSILPSLLYIQILYRQYQSCCHSSQPKVCFVNIYLTKLITPVLLAQLPLHDEMRMFQLCMGKKSSATNGMML